MAFFRLFGLGLCLSLCVARKAPKEPMSISASDTAVGGISISHPSLTPKERKLPYGARRSASDYLATFDDNTVQNMVPCSHYKNNPGTCNPFAEHSPCVYCKVQQKLKIDLKWFGKINLWKDHCPDHEAFAPSITGYAWRLTERKFAGDIRVCVVEKETAAAEEEAIDASMGTVGGGAARGLTTVQKKALGSGRQTLGSGRISSGCATRLTLTALLFVCGWLVL